jgi:hypothetical protein
VVGDTFFIAASRRDICPYAGNSHRLSGNALECGRDALAKLKYMTDRQDASRRCARRIGGPDGDPFFVRASTQTDQDGPFVSAGCVDPERAFAPMYGFGN